MRFNAKKCNIMRVSRSVNPLTHMYQLGNHVLELVGEVKYLGLNISDDLSWTTHISKTTKKANLVLAFLR